MITACLGIIHAAHLPERRRSMNRLRSTLWPLPEWVTHYREHHEHEDPRSYHARSWRWAVATGADFSLVLNDDAIPAPFFWDALAAILDSFPARTVLGLACVDPCQREWADRGERYFHIGQTSVGWGVGLWRQELQILIDELWKLPPDHRSPHSHDACPPDCALWHEDAWANEVFRAHDREVWHPIPSILDHDTSLPSTYASDHHKTRRPAVLWNELTRPDFWRARP